MKALDSLFRFFIRFRYPVTLPEDVASSLGIHLSNFVTFDNFVKKLTDPDCCPTTLYKMMDRRKAEETFCGAQRIEQFQRNTLISYYFNEGWLEFNLHFDESSRLRRLYIQHKQIKSDQGIEVSLILAPKNKFNYEALNQSQ